MQKLQAEACLIGLIWNPVTVVAVFLAAIFGWGRLMQMAFYRDTAVSPAFRCTLGLALLSFFGGWLNLFRLASVSVLEGLAVIGAFATIALSGPELYRRTSRCFRAPREAITSLHPAVLLDALPLLPTFAVAVFLSLYFVPAHAFDLQDDFTKYLAPIFQMLQTGGMAGREFQELGLTQLGTQPYLQGFFLTRLPFANLHWFDLVVCSCLAALLLDELGRSLGCGWFARTAAVSLFWAINPQVVNITALYSGILIILALACAGMMFLRLVAEKHASAVCLARGAVPIGLLAALLVSLKGTFVPFTLVFCLLLLAGALFLLPRRTKILLSTLLALLTFAVFLIPWMLLSKNSYFDFLAAAFQGARLPPPAADMVVNAQAYAQLLFSRQALVWGGTLEAYNAAFLAVVVAGMLIAIQLRNGAKTPVGSSNIAVFAVLASTIGGYLTNAELTHLYVKDTIRYSAPLLIAALPLGVMAIGGLPKGGMTASPSLAPMGRFMKAGIAAFAVPVVAVFGLFGDTFVARARQMANNGSAIAYDIANRDVFLRFLGRTQDPRSLQGVRQLQSGTERGTGIFVWADIPFLFDFSRNPVWMMESARLVLADFPESGASSGADFAEYLKRRRIRYVFWQFDGVTIDNDKDLREEMGIPVLAAEAGAKWRLRELLRALESGNKVVFRSRTLVIYDLGGSHS